MKHLRYWTLTVLALALILLPGSACGPDFPTAVFVRPDAPDGDYAHFAAGHLGVLQPGFHSRSLAIAYVMLTGGHLDPAAQQQAVAANEHFVNPSSDGSNLWSDKPLPGFTAWIAARSAFGPVDAYAPDDKLEINHPLDANEYDTFTNCLDPAFITAATTLAALTQQHGPHDPTLTEWVRGQDAVFSNCGDGKPRPYYGPPDKAPPAPPAPHLPAAVPNAPLWLQQDRAYQLAAAQFYAMHYDAALTSFRAIAADTASPWSITARYLEARILIRKASLMPMPSVSASDGVPLTDQQRAAAQQSADQKLQAAKALSAKSLQQAQQSLIAMQTEPRMAPMRDAIDGLLDYVNARLEPDTQTITLASRILAPSNPRLRQSLIDFTALHTSTDTYGALGLQHANKPAPGHADTATHPQPAADLEAWVDALNNNNAAAALARWRATPTTPWLVAAILFAQPNDPDTPALVAAAKHIATTDPAWLTVTHHRLRLTPHDPTTRAELLTLLPRLRKTEGPSTVNLFTALLAPTAPTLEAWLPTTPRTPAAESSYDDTDAQPLTQPKEDVCGHAVTSFQLFDTDAAVAFNRQLPLRLLATAAESQALPANLRFQVAQATLTRAILLDKPAIANRMAPILESCRAAWKPVLDAYAAARTPTDRHAAGLFALMRFASTEPSVREGEERRQGFATYDELRQNWWCSTVPLPTETVDAEPVAWRPNADPDAVRGSDPAGMTTHPHIAPPPPPFLTAADLAEAHTEVATLEAIPNASTWFARQAIDWFQAHPTDPRTPELLGQADRVLRNACRHDQPYGKPPGPDSTATCAHTLFDILHQHFPTNHWTLRYKTWE